MANAISISAAAPRERAKVISQLNVATNCPLGIFGTSRNDSTERATPPANRKITRKRHGPLILWVFESL